ncbi:hypothetical protein M404DRAFT_533008 [Pisolithus tinctorius Marx 270]|uniref:Uncharacterized protein n=1 Tax=Pisolithus tinctorius Marx 270 TaxID=870435 RepID=A0A0C3J7Q6_PISTI|nr:hypothetical protein M404DRAFT_533008 [Pisolithus tinctorius Marx 270]
MRTTQRALPEVTIEIIAIYENLHLAVSLSGRAMKNLLESFPHLSAVNVYSLRDFTAQDFQNRIQQVHNASAPRTFRSFAFTQTACFMPN